MGDSRDFGYDDRQGSSRGGRGFEDRDRNGSGVGGAYGRSRENSTVYGNNSSDRYDSHRYDDDRQRPRRMSGADRNYTDPAGGWYFVDNQHRTIGPKTEQNMADLVASKQIKAQTQIWQGTRPANGGLTMVEWFGANW